MNTKYDGIVFYKETEEGFFLWLRPEFFAWLEKYSYHYFQDRETRVRAKMDEKSRCSCFNDLVWINEYVTKGLYNIQKHFKEDEVKNFHRRKEDFLAVLKDYGRIFLGGHPFDETATKLI